MKKSIPSIVMLVVLIIGIALTAYGVTGRGIYDNAANMMGVTKKDAMSFIQDPASLTALGDISNIGTDKVKSFLNDKAAAANYKPEYERTADNIVSYWFHLFMFILAFGILSTITLEFIDKDKR